MCVLVKTCVHACMCVSGHICVQHHQMVVVSHVFTEEDHRPLFYRSHHTPWICSEQLRDWKLCRLLRAMPGISQAGTRSVAR